MVPQFVEGQPKGEGEEGGGERGRREGRVEKRRSREGGIKREGRRKRAEEREGKEDWYMYVLYTELTHTSTDHAHFVSLII